MSLRASRLRSPAACSGLMYSTVPTEIPSPGHARFGHTARESNAEVGEQRFTVLEEDVLGLYVAMEHTLAMREVQRAGDLLRDANCFGDGESALAREAIAQGFAGHERHDVEQCAFDTARVV